MLQWPDKAIQIWERLVKAGQEDSLRSLAKGCFNKAITLHSDGQAQQALEWHNRGIEIYERLVRQEGQWEIANELSNVYIRLANGLRSLGEHQEAHVAFEKAIELHDTLANLEGRQEFAGDLARVRALCADTGRSKFNATVRPVKRPKRGRGQANFR